MPVTRAMIAMSVAAAETMSFESRARVVSEVSSMSQRIGWRGSSVGRYVSVVTTDSRIDSDRARATRIFWIVLITVVIEVGLYIVAYLGPAMAHLIRPVYLIVAAVGVATTWHALRRRVG